MNINEIKNKILQLAIQGKLVPQDENDIPASVLLEEIKKEKEQLIKEKKIKKEKPLPEITEEEKPFNLPKGWQWCRLADIIILISGRDLSSNLCNSDMIGIPYVMGASNMTNNGLIIERWVKNPTVIGIKEDIMISVKGTVGKLEIINLDEVHLSRQVMSIRCINNLINNKFVLIYLNSYIEKIKQKSSGVIPGISREDILQVPLALPSVAEQQRIVDKVDELFSIIDELAENKEAMLKDISDTRNKVLQLAIQGKLVEQDENDEPAAILLERIAEERERLIKEKKIKKEKSLPEITEEEKPFELPKGWQWVRLGEIGSYKKGPFGSTITKSMFVPKSEETIKVYEQKNAIQKNWTLGDYYVTKEYFEAKLKGFEVFEGDIIVSCAGTIGETYIMPQGIERGVINQALMKMNIFNGINIDYFLMYFESILKSTAKESSKGSAIKNIPPFDIFKKMLLAVPPIAEQQRIVQKVDKIMAYLDELEKTII